MTDSEILAAAIEYVQGAHGDDNQDAALLDFLVLEICDRGLLQRFGQLVLQTLLQNDIARLYALRAIKVASVTPRGGANDQG
jgi:hypothetical protein